MDELDNGLLIARRQFVRGELDKFEYAAAVAEWHKLFFNYVEFIRDTDVARISIDVDGVFVQSAKHDISIRLDPVDTHGVPYTLLGFGAYEKVETDFLKSIFIDGEVFLDVGANLGWFSLVLGRAFPNAKIFALEPVPSTFLQLENNIAINELVNIDVTCIGLYEEKGEFEFLFSEDVSGATSMKMVGQARGKLPVQAVLCKTTTLNDFCQEHNISPFLIKIDVEGAELMVLRGGLEVLNSRPVLLMELLRKWSSEFGYHPNEVFYLLERYGYDAWVFTEEGFLRKCLMITQETVETNFVFLHPEAHASIILKWGCE